uniref:Uncharacterized protein n=1 Tax=Eutreptiella gymnastica TaxID=73025 RepID=A0A7S1J562_9EUGL|mmetsp:Transcript_66831/g.118589  ORF Transcript_66831/g.118589 Transcript_66831/m.118589 type:complete len:289 (+) Transcript_66831:63-929(+)
MTPVSPSSRYQPAIHHVVRYRWQPIACCAVAVFMLLCGVLMNTSTWWLDDCYHDRFSHPMVLFPTADQLLYLTEFCVVLCLGASFWGPLGGSMKAMSRKPLAMDLNLSELVDTLATLIWYFGSFALVLALKYILDDRNCSTHPNSVSGHTNLFVFTIPTLFVLRYRSARHPPFRKSECIWLLPYLGTIVLSVWQLFRTFVWGFHSLRQMLYGGAFGVMSHTAWMLVLFHHHEQLPLIALLVMGVANCVCMVIVPSCRHSFVPQLCFVPLLLAAWRASYNAKHHLFLPS